MRRLFSLIKTLFSVIFGVLTMLIVFMSISVLDSISTVILGVPSLMGAGAVFSICCGYLAFKASQFLVIGAYVTLNEGGDD